MSEGMHISIDGPTGAGKTTLGVGLARHFGAAFLDTGITYRALAFALSHADLDSDDAWTSSLVHTPLLYKEPCDEVTSPAQVETVFYKGRDITQNIWGIEVDNRLDIIARDSVKRNEILAYHRRILDQHPRIVVAGRDIATTLLKNATLHVFLTANFAIRRERRRTQHLENPSRSVVVGSVTQRDLSTLEECRRMRNAIILDTTYLPKSVILNYIIDRVKDEISSRSEE